MGKIYNLVLEGVDCSGKSTIIKKLENKKSRVETRHCIPVFDKDTKKSLINMDWIYWHLCRQIQRESIYDRWYGTSDIIYNPKNTAVDADKLILDIWDDHANTVLFVFILMDPTVIANRLQIRGDEFYELDDIQKYNQLYRDLCEQMRSYNVPCVVFDVKKDSATVSDEIAEMCAKYQETGVYDYTYITING